jgi:transposase
MSKESQNQVGIDVCKAHLDCCLPGGRKLRVPNTPGGFQSLLSLLPANSHVFMEATGGYERELLAALHAAGVAASVLNPLHVRHFARAKRLLAKTDAIDAKVLADYGCAVPCRLSSPPHPTQSAVAELCSARELLVGHRSALLCASSHLKLPAARKAFQAQLRSLDSQIEKIEAAILKVIQADHACAARYATVRSIRGIGPTTAAILMAALPELGSLSNKKLCALAGLAPFNHDSGPRCGKRSVHGGRRPVRRALFLATLSVIRFDSGPSSFYHRLKNAGKPAKLALIAAARKLLCLLNRLLKSAWILPDFSPAK